MSSQGTVRLPSRVRTVTPGPSATVRSRMTIADNTTGMTSSGADGGQASTGINNPSVKNPTAMCAIGEILITTGGGVGADEPVGTRASFHPAGAVADLTAELCEGYRRELWNPPESPECS